MKVNGVKIYTLSLMLLLVGGLMLFSRIDSRAQAASQTGATNKGDALKEIAAYRSWTKINITPLRVNNFTIDGQDA